jgi:hypothetical protein
MATRIRRRTARLFSYLRQAGATNAVFEAMAGIIDGLVSEALRCGPAAAYELFQTAADDVVTRHGVRESEFGRE